MSSSLMSTESTQKSETRLLTPLRSVATSPSGEYPPRGFGFEFEHCLNQRWEADMKRQEARREKYENLGMDTDDMRRSTPDHIREAYFQLVHADLNDVHTPTPSPPPTDDLTIHSVTSRPSRAVNTKLATGKSKYKGVDGAGKSKARTGKQSKRANRNGMHIIKTRPTAKSEKRHRQRSAVRPQQGISTHHMITRSKVLAITCGPPPA